MKFERPYSFNYNGGVFRFTPEGETEQIVIWETANLTTQQHSSSATFSAPTTDGRQAWMTVNTDGAIIGGGVHGSTQDSYLRCGAARNGVPVVGVEQVSIPCRTGVFVMEDGQVGLPGTPQYTQQTPVTIRYDFSKYPYVSISAQPYITEEFSFGGPASNQIFDATFNGRPAKNYFYGNALGFSILVQDGKPVGFSEARPSPVTVINLECGTF